MSSTRVKCGKAQRCLGQKALTLVKLYRLEMRHTSLAENILGCVRYSVKSEPILSDDS